MMQRPITSGSRQAPDPFDQFLESCGLYRKHTARDASSLFRVIAEQMYDTQMLHYEVRLECVRFMTRKRRIFEKYVGGNFDAYMLDMAKPKTYGTMLELRAMCCLYKRNVVLYEAFNLGTAVTFNLGHTQNFSVFFTKENHFDSVFAVDYIKTAAACQSISFKLLYKMIFMLPDLEFAIENMLYPQTFDMRNCKKEIDSNGYAVSLISEGRYFKLDLPNYTKCILENFKLCNFHIMNQPKNVKLINRRSVKLNLELNVDNMSTIENHDTVQMCPDAFTSCVRQLLEDGITPFPYKVAKALDSNMYRNVEFDCWNDTRKEAKRFNVYVGDYNFKVGAKCHVELMKDYERQLYICHIQKIDKDKSYCIVYVEDFGKKLVVPYNDLYPLAQEEFRPWALPFRNQRRLQRVHLARLVNRPKMNRFKKAKIFSLGSYFDAGRFENDPYLSMDTDTDSFHYPMFLNGNEHTWPANDTQQQHQQSALVEQNPKLARPQHLGLKISNKSERNIWQEQHRNHFETSRSVQVDSIRQSQFHPPPFLPLMSPQTAAWHLPNDEFQSIYAHQFSPPLGDNRMIMPFGYPPQMQPPYMPLTRINGPPLLTTPPAYGNGLLSPPASPAKEPTGKTVLEPPMPLMPPPQELEIEPRHSLRPNGEDLPGNVGTLRYFYNMGVDMHKLMLQRSGEMLPRVEGFPEDAGLRTVDVKPILGSDGKLKSAHGEVTNEISLKKKNVKGYGTGNSHAKRLFIKHREEQQIITHIGNNCDVDQMEMTAIGMLPTPTPSPTKPGTQFNFYAAAQAPSVTSKFYLKRQ